MSQTNSREKPRDTVLGWHFTDGNTLRDGRPVPPAGEWLEHDGALVMCSEGLHMSRHVIDALKYAPGATLHRVCAGGDMIYGDDKLCCQRRKVIWTLPDTVMKPLLSSFARQCALRVIHLWDAPDVVVRYLETGDEQIRAAARDASWASSWAAAREAALDAALDARAAARDESRAARDARDAAEDAAKAVETRWQRDTLQKMVWAARRDQQAAIGGSHE